MPLNGSRVAWKEPGALAFQGIYTAAANTADKPLLAVGPDGWHHLLYMGPHPCEEPLRAARSDNPMNQTAWPNLRVQPFTNPNCAWEGWGVTPVVLSDNRVVVVVRDTDPLLGGRYNANLPYVVYSIDQGLTWLPPSEQPIRVAENSGIQATTIEVAGTGGDTPEQIDRRKCAPAIAVDYATTPNHVYVAFYARSAPGSTNTDIYISLSTDGGETFPSDSLHLLHLTDYMLTGQSGATSVPDQVMPAIAIDAYGGVNVVFYDNRNAPDPADPNSWADVYYVRITGFGTSNPGIFQKRLTPRTFLLGTTFLGDYHHFAAAGTNPQHALYAAYIATAQDGGGQWAEQNCYLHRITFLFLSDLNQNGEPDPGDIALFTAAYNTKTSLADLNADGMVDEKDTTLFWEDYNGAGNK